MRTDSLFASSSRSLALLLFGGALLLVGLVPVAGWEALPDLCLFHRLTGLLCPTCGLTRSWAALARGQIGMSLHFHALGAPALVLVGLGLGLSLAGRLRPIPSMVKILGVALWSAYAIGRMLGLLPGP
ncbi:hypothetical protein GETHLI_34540 [Geothrix limicola]|uniref:DUF2752 domain-containing protein n=1 Tax=Geothrix limicola TaxID=2927978 RepID=A0ABQ5QJS1_9BACT|nr:DUF2752 domain-containing protein [Geothrix limicola]GLH74952.1 hypothetical protein GETHLI_34540 [Geothrix limicola]